MKKDLSNYILKTDDLIKEKKITKKLIEEHLIKIGFFQHERLIHLLVTLSFALFTIIFIIASALDPLFFIIAIITFILLVFYIFYYFFLENKVQYLYKQYDLMKEME